MHKHGLYFVPYEAARRCTDHCVLIYTDSCCCGDWWLPAGETLLRKLGRADMIKKQSVPEICFAYFHNK